MTFEFGEKRSLVGLIAFGENSPIELNILLYAIRSMRGSSWQNFQNDCPKARPWTMSQKCLANFLENGS